MPSRILQQQAAQELLRRRTLRRSLTEFARALGYEPAAHHRLLIGRLERLARGSLRRLMVFMPPGAAKSTYASVLLPAWYLAQPNAGNIIAASHSTALAERFGRKVRNLVGRHAHLLGYGLARDATAAGRWSTTRGLEYYAAGVGVGIAGFRSKLNVIDDPFRNRQDADSQLVRDRVWEWYNDDLDTRLVPGGAVALIMTRWHEDDLAGRLMQRMAVGGERWEIVSLPALAEDNDALGRVPGEWLWEGDYGYAERLREKHAVTDPRSWAALYQQRPAPEAGDYFRRAWFRFVEAPPARDRLRVYGASDYAVTAEAGDWTVHLVAGLDPAGDLYVLDLWRERTTPDLWIEAWCDLVLRWGPEYWAEEGGQIKAAIGPFLEERAGARKAWTVREQFPARHDKAVRAQSIRARLSMRGLYLPAYRPWSEPLIGECLAFPAGRHDDQVDALGLIGQLLDRMEAAPAAGAADRLASPPDLHRFRRDDGSWRV